MGSMALDDIGGYNFSGIVSQMMKIERAAGDVMTAKKDSYNKQVTALQSLNAKVSSITTNALAILGKSSMTDLSPEPDKVWAAAKASTSNTDLLTVKANTGAAAGSLDITVKNVATSQQVVLDSNAVAKLGQKIMSGDANASNAADRPPQSISIVVGNKITTVKPTTGSAQDIARAINSAKESGVSATAVRMTDGTYMLQITGTETGEDGKFQMYVGDLNAQMRAADTADTSRELKTTSTKTGDGYETVTYTNNKFQDDGTTPDNSFEDLLSTALSNMKTQTESGANFPGGTSTFKVFGDAHIARQAVNAKIELFSGTDHATTVESSSNTFDKLMDNVDITINADKYTVNSAGVPVDEKNQPLAEAKLKGNVSVTEDNSPASEAVRKMVNAINLVVDEIASQTKTSTKQKDDGSGDYIVPGTLGSDSTTRGLRNAIRSLMGSGIQVKNEDGTTSTYSLRDLGIKLKADGSAGNKMEFDADAFAKLMKEDPNKVKKLATAFATQVANVSDSYANSDKDKGMLTSAIEQKQSSVKSLTERITAFNTRMDTKEKNLKLQFATLQTTLAKMSQQGGYLASQLAGLSSSSS